MLYVWWNHIDSVKKNLYIVSIYNLTSYKNRIPARHSLMYTTKHIVVYILQILNTWASRICDAEILQWTRLESSDKAAETQS